jgi:general nucleoside transport system permease protein
MSAGNATIIATGGISLTVPMLIAACGEYTAERGGTLNISVTGMMLTGAYAGIAAADIVPTPFALLAGVAVGLVIAIVHANFCHRLTANTFVVGLTLNAFALGLTDYLSTSFGFQQHHVATVAIPGLSSIPVVGPSVFDLPWPGYIVFALVPATWYLVERTRWGLELRAAGSNPQGADASGVRVDRRRRQALYLCGILSGLGGAYLSLAVVGTFNQNMTNGEGFIVITAVIFGGWRLSGAVAGCLLFGIATSLTLVLPAAGVQLPGAVLTATPYTLALVAMLFFAASKRQPAALAQPFERGMT